MAASASNPSSLQPSHIATSTAPKQSFTAHQRSQTDPSVHLVYDSFSRSSRTSFDVSSTSRPDTNHEVPDQALPIHETDVTNHHQITTFEETRFSRSRKNYAALKTPSKPILHQDSRLDRSTSLLTPDDSLPSLQGPSKSLKSLINVVIEARPATLKRSPASHSSYGVETSNGPPPSFSTQRKISQDRSWKPATSENEDLTTNRPLPLIITTQLPNFETSPTHTPAEQAEVIDESSANQSQQNQSMELPGIDSSPIGSIEEEKDITLRAVNGGSDEEGKGSSSDGPEDLFLNIAKAEEDKAILARAERRRSRLGASLLSPGFSADHTVRQSTQIPSSYSSRRLSLNPNSSPASPHTADEPTRLRYFGQHKPTVSTSRSIVDRDTRESSPESPQVYKRRSSIADSTSRLYRQSNLAAPRSSRMVSASVAETPTIRQVEPEKSRVEGTESTISTTAPSTVWDELDDLKSRIRKLELTGKLPPSSAAAMASTSNERPQTATTTVTTMSSSPKHGRKKDSPVETSIAGVPSTVHPLLHEALTNARSTVNNDIYQKLEAAAADALQLASMMSEAQNTSNHVLGGGSSNERQARRRVDSLCRGLTELSIALSAQNPRPSTANARSHSREPSSPAVTESLRFRHASQEPEDRGLPTPRVLSRIETHRLSQEPEDRGLPTPRVQSRLDSRRSSMLIGSQLNSPRYTSESTVNGVSSTMQPQRTTSRLHRNSISLRNRRAHDGQEDEMEEDSPSTRPLSRALTEALTPTFKSSPRDRSSLAREYTSQHPLPSREPDSSPRSPSITTRRTTYGGLGSSPLNQNNTTPSFSLRRYGTTAGTSTLPSHLTRSSKNSPAMASDASQESPSMDDSSGASANRPSSIRQRLSSASTRLGTSVGSRLRGATKEPDNQRRNRLSEGDLLRSEHSQRIMA